MNGFDRPLASVNPVAKRTTIRLVLLSLGAYLLLIGLPLLRGIPPLLGTIGATVIFAGVSVALIAAGSRLPLSGLQDLAGMMGTGGLWLALTRLAASSEVSKLLIGPAASVVFLLTCLFMGRLISRILREPNILLPVCVVAAAADIFTVFWGPTAQFLEAAPQVVRSLSVAIPETGSATGPAGVAGLSFVATMGLGDFIFLAVFFTAAARLGFNLRRTAWIIGTVLAVGLTGFFFVPFLAHIPLLPFIGVGFLLANWQEFHLTTEEKRALLYAALIIGVVVIVIGLLARLS